MFAQLFSKDYWFAIILLTKMSIIKRNANSFLGGLWNLIQPLANILIISYVMSYILRYSPSIIIPNMIGALPFWTFIVVGITSASESLIAKGEILKRSLLPKSYFSISEVLNQVYTLAYSFVAVYFVLIIFYPDKLTWKVISIPFLALPMIISVISAGIAVSFLTVYVRDFTQALNVIFGILYWTLPIIYPFSLVPESKRVLYYLNPLFLVIRPMQTVITTSEFPSLSLVLASWVVPIIVTAFSYFIYRKLTKNVIYYL